MGRDDDGEGDGEEGDDDDDDEDDDEEMKMSEASTYSYKPIRKSKKYRKSHEPRSYRNKRSTSKAAGVTESQAMEETMDLVDGLREEQRRKKLTKKYCKKCKAAMNCNGADFSKCNKVRNKCKSKFNVR